MTYLNFFTKRALKNPITAVTIGLTLIILIVTLVMNLKTYKTVLLETNTRQDLNSAYRSKKMAAQDLKKYKKGSDTYEAAVADHTAALVSIQEDTKIISDLKDGQYSAAYEIALKQNNAEIAATRASKFSSSDEDQLTGLKRENLRLKALKASGFKEQSEDYPVDALGFLASCFKYDLPVLLTIITIFILSQTFAERFVDKLDVGSLIPFNRGSISFADAGAGLVVSLGIVILISAFTVMIAGVTSGFGHWTYPMFTYVSGTSQMKFVNTGAVILKTIPLSLLFLLFSVVVCNFVSILTRNRMTSLFISIVVLVALPLTTWLVIPMHAFAHWLPTTYLFSELTVTGELGKTFDNYQLTSGFGLIVMVYAIAIIVALTWIVDRHRSH